LDLANALREERKTAELQHLDRDFYHQVGAHLVSLTQELSAVLDPYSVEAQILQDTLKSEKSSMNKLIDQRMKKIVRKAVRNARSASQDDVQGMTEEEEEIYRSLLSAIMKGRETIIAHLAHTEKPQNIKASEGYEVVRMLESVPIFVGVDGRNYSLSKDDVVTLPAVHARNLTNKNLALEVKVRNPLNSKK
jgi:DNA replication factor GINS